MQKENGNFTAEEIAVLEQNRKDTPYISTFEEDAVSYPIPDLIGSTRLIAVDRDTIGANEVTFGLSEFRPRSAVHKAHSHPESEEIMYILEGCGVTGVEGKDAIMKKGDILFVPKGAKHYFYNPFEEPCKFLFLYTKGSLKDAGYALQSGSNKDLGEEIEQLQKSGNNKFDEQ